MKTPMHPELIAEIIALCDEIGMPVSYFGKEAVNDFSLVPDLKGGRELKRATLAKVRACIEDLRTPRASSPAQRGQEASGPHHPDASTSSPD